MDSWSNEQVDNMRKVGNAASNKVYNPIGQKPPVPIDADEADSAMERFIRQKYINSAFSKPTNAGRHRSTDSSGSDDIPPPLPPKTPGRLNVRSVSSIFPLPSRVKDNVSANIVVNHSTPGNLDKHNTTPTSPLPRAMSYPRPESSGSGAGSRIRSKVSQVFGSDKHTDGSESLDGKLARLRDMGFSDDRRNTVVLKAVSWDLDRAIDMLVRMGDAGVSNGRLSPHPLASPRDSSLSAPTRTFNPTASMTTATRLSVPLPTSLRTPSSPSANSGINPFDTLETAPSPAPPQSSQSTGTLQNQKLYSATNPFGIVPTPPQQATPFNPTVTASTSAFNLHQAFQKLALSPPQPLFPHHTGSSMQQQHQHQHQQALQAQSPLSVSSAGQPYFSSTFPAGRSHQSNLPQRVEYNNPFMNVDNASQQQQLQPVPHVQYQRLQSPMQPQQPLSVVTSDFPNGTLGNNPFTRSPTRIQSPNALGQIPEQSQASYFTTLSQSHTYPLPNGNPSGTSLSSLQNSNPQLPQPPQRPMNNPFVTQPPPQPQPPRLHNTASIMALYNMQPLSPVVAQPLASPLDKPVLNPLQPPAQQQSSTGESLFNKNESSQTHLPTTTRVANNPFLTMSNTTSMISTYAQQNSQYPTTQPSLSSVQRQPPPPTVASPSGTTMTVNPADLFVSGRSRDSIMALGMEWSNGRHSPDAFASLSAHH
ncbi:uncharacterized protein SPSK_02297 [Sporothrix schenckii 1099-18]|uniref:UBA domain-containing protein n=1 Tax=Sporothrix schenckii 1099-18 TaxID=1397361 RepID=A0A0F2MCT7_SPOSC|nr:uncharacterized protein SPSK_02297 [Sporothrix schenckii 1099-18]KJR86660.1 hypothetical protein SPSK_02297 [Sporothrix schenckii 1099-18]